MRRLVKKLCVILDEISLCIRNTPPDGPVAYMLNGLFINVAFSFSHMRASEPSELAILEAVTRFIDELQRVKIPTNMLSRSPDPVVHAFSKTILPYMNELKSLWINMYAKHGLIKDLDRALFCL